MSPRRQEIKVGWKGVWEQQVSTSSAVGGFIVPPQPLHQVSPRPPELQVSRNRPGAELDEPGGFDMTFGSL